MHIHKTRGIFWLVIIVVFITLFALLLTNRSNSIELNPSEYSSIDTNVVEKVQEESTLGIFFSREVPKEITAKGAIIILRLNYPTPRAVDIYEKLPSGFRINNELGNLESIRLDYNTYLFEIPRLDKLLGTAIEYKLEMEESVKPGTYEINGWIESNNKREDTPVSKILVVQ